jgi:hypothetical protein
MTSTQALEDAEVRRNNAQSDLVAARSRWPPPASSCAAPRCARPSTAWSASARSRPATRRRSARNCQGDRPAQHALRGPGLGRPHARAEARPGGELPRQRLSRRTSRQGAAHRRRGQRHDAAGGGRGGLRRPGPAPRWRACSPKGASRPAAQQALAARGGAVRAAKRRLSGAWTGGQLRKVPVSWASATRAAATGRCWRAGRRRPHPAQPGQHAGRRPAVEYATPAAARLRRRCRWPAPPK